VSKSERVDVNESAGKQGPKETEISRQTIYALSALWQIQSRLSQIQNLPDLFQNVGERGKNTGSQKSQLVANLTCQM
jgi:hypothetical protein